MSRRLWAVVLVALTLHATGVAAQRPTASEYEVKAAYLLNFIRFVHWPGRASSGPIELCVLGADPFGRTLDSSLADQPQGETVVIIKRLSSVEQARACHVLFVSASEEGRLPRIMAALGSADVLTVSDMSGFAGRGGMIQFVADRGRIRFEVNLPAAERAGLMMSSELLRVARNVRTGR
jgi:hypothetical protein